MAKPLFGKSIDFDKNVGAGNDPVSPNGGLLVSAGNMQGEAGVVDGQGRAAEAQWTGKVIETVGGTVLDATKGYMQSNLEADIKKTVDSYEAVTKVDDAKLTLDLFEGGMSQVTPAEVEKAKADIAKYKDAVDQGVMTRDQALLAIDARVKESSRTMPGWASEFRKQAEQLTGVAHMGNYREHTLLSQQSVKDKLRLDAAKFVQDTQQRMITMYVEAYGKLPEGGHNGPDMAMFRQQLALKQQAEGLKKQLEVRDSTISQNEPKVQNLIQSRMADGILTLNQKLQGLTTAVGPDGKMITPENKIVVRQRILSDINNFFEPLKAELLSYNANQVSNGTREQMLNRLNTQQKELVDSLKNQDNFDDFRKTMELRAASAADVMNKWAIANPHLKIIKESGIATPDVAKLWIDWQQDPKKQAEFRRIYGNPLDDYFRSITTGGPGASNAHANNMVGSSTNIQHMQALKLTNPAAYQASLMGLKDHIRTTAMTGWGDTQEMQDVRKANFADNLSVFSSQISATDPNAVDTWIKLMSDPRVAARVSELSPQQVAAATGPTIQKTREIIENPEFGVMARIAKIRDKLSVTHRANAFELMNDPTTNQIKVLYYPFEGVMQGKNEERNMGKRGKPDPILGDGSQVGDEGKELARLVKAANGSLGILTNFSASLPPDLQGKGLLEKDIVEKFQQGYFGMGVADRAKTLQNKKPAPAGMINNSADFNAAIPKRNGGISEEDGMGIARLREAGMDLVQVENHINNLSQELKRKGLNSTVKQILTRELSGWERAKKLHGDEGVQALLNNTTSTTGE